MQPLSHADSFEVLVLQAACDGRADVLFGDSVPRAREWLRPFMVGEECPDIYLEHPLKGDPFLDVTVLMRRLVPGTRIDSPAAAGTEALLDWYAQVQREHEDVGFGFELDSSQETLPAAAIHFQPHAHTELVVPFCEAAREPERARLYLDLAARMPKGWPLSFFGMFRGRPGSPLRVCGYLSREEKGACAADPARLARAFDEIGFTAYDKMLLAQATELMGVDRPFDFQFDVYPDGHLGPTFAFDVQFKIQRPELVREAFANGPVADVMGRLEAWGAADGRWKLAGDAAFARAIPVELPGGALGRLAFTLMPQWTKIRWTDGVLQPSKLYLIGHAGIVTGTP